MHRQPKTGLASRLKSSLQEQFQFADTDRRVSGSFLTKCVQLLKVRTQFENEFIEKGKYLFLAPTQYDEQAIQKKWKPELAGFFQNVSNAFGGMPMFTASEIEKSFKETATANNLKPGDVIQLFRVFLSGQSAGVDLFPMAELLGKEEVIGRINAALNHLKL